MREPSPYFIQRTMPPFEPKPVVLDDPVLSAEPIINLRDYWITMRKHTGLIGAVMLSAVVLTALIVFMMKPDYDAQSKLLIEHYTPQVLDMRQIMTEPQVPDEYDYYKTQYEILKSPSLAATVIHDTGLTEKQLLPEPRESATGLISGLFKQVTDRLAKTSAGANLLHRLHMDEEKASTFNFGIDSKLIDAYLDRLAVVPQRGTRLVTIGFRTTSPALSATVANAHAKAYIKRGVELNGNTNEEAEKFLEEKLVELKERVEKSEEALNAYRRDKGIISLNEKEDLVTQRLDELNKNLTTAEGERIAYEAQEIQIKKREYNSLPAVISNDLIQKLKQESSREEGLYAAMAAKFKPGYPPLDQAKAQLDETQTRLLQEISRVVGGIETTYLAAMAKENGLRQEMDKQKALALNQKDAGVQYAILAREVDTNKQLYDSVLQRMKETGVAAQVRSSNVFVIDAAQPPNRPSKPRKLQDLVISAIMSLGLGIALSFLLEYLDNTLRNPDEVERYLHLPNLSVVPNFLQLNGLVTNGASKIQSGQPATISASSKELIAFRDRFSPVTESYRTLRTAILLSRAGEPPKTLLVTSAGSGEGKTVTAVNTAVLFAQMGARVLLVDADLRRPRCHKLLRVENRVGLSEVLTGQVEAQEAIMSTTVDQLFLMTAGTPPPNPAELMGSLKMQQTLEQLKLAYDFVIFDSVPTVLVSDALPLSTMVDGAIVVVNGPGTPKHLVKAACDRLKYVGATILGVVLNQVDVRTPDYYYSYYYSSYSSSYHHPPQAGKAA